MKILKILHESFDNKDYVKKNISECAHSDKVIITGIINILKKKTKTGSDYYNITITDESGKISTPAWSNSEVFSFLDESDSNKLVQIEGEVSVNRYTNITIHNISFVEKDDEEIAEEDSNSEDLMEMLNQRIACISNSVLNSIVQKIIDSLYEELKVTPFSEKTAYAYKGGLVRAMIDMYDITLKLVDTINSNTFEDALNVNLDLLLSGALLSNIGKCKSLKIDINGIISKTMLGQLEEDSIFSREICGNVISSTLEELKDDENYEEIEKECYELLHMISSVKNNLNWGALTTPRSKHAMLLAHINNLVYTKGLFENLEKNNTMKNEFTKAYDGGKSYFLG